MINNPKSSTNESDNTAPESSLVQPQYQQIKKWEKSAEFEAFTIQAGVIGFFEKPVLLKSGKKSSWYVNWRHATADAFTLDRLTDYILDYLSHSRTLGAFSGPIDCIYGVPEGGTKLGIACQMKLARAAEHYARGSHCVAMGRAKPKEHGVSQDRYFVGTPQGRTVIIEDTVTTGGSLLSSVDSLLEAKIELIGVIALTDRMERRDDGLSVAEAIAQRKTLSDTPLQYFSMTNAPSILPQAAAHYNLSADVRQRVNEEIKERSVVSYEV